MPGDGKSLEQIIYALERVLRLDNDVSIESPKRITDKITGKKREHDVVLTINQGHHQINVAIECRDRSRPIGVNQIESFWKKCQDTGIDKGVMVSTTGFYNTARKKADFLDIRCLDIEEVDAFDWMLTPSLRFVERKLLHIEWVFHPEKDNIANKTNMEIIDKEGNQLVIESLTPLAREQLNILLAVSEEPQERALFTIKFPVVHFIIRNTDTNETTPVKYAIAKIYYSVTNEDMPFKLVQYKDLDVSITNAAVASMTLGEVSGKFMFVEQKDGRKKVLYLPDD